MYLSLIKDTQNREFKKVVNYNILTTICAFMNTDGGTILVGYSDSEIIGIKDIKFTLEKLNNLISKKLPSEIHNLIHINNYVINGKNIIVLEVEKSNVSIHVDGKFFKRLGNRNVSYNPEIQKELDAGILPIIRVNQNINYYKIGGYAKGGNFYRYMGLEAAILCLRNSSIRFVEPCTWSDKFESRFYNATIHGQKASGDNPLLYAYCVTNKKDNEAAWKIYSYNAIGLAARCVQFKINRKKFREEIINAIKDDYCLYEGVIKYEDEQKMRTIHMPMVQIGKEMKPNFSYGIFFKNFSLRKYLNLLLLKRSAFMHEQEVRFFIVPTNMDDLNKGQCKPVNLPINWSKVIEEIIIDDSCTSLEEELLIEAITKYGNGGQEINSPDLLLSLKPKRCNIYGSEDDGKPLNIK